MFLHRYSIRPRHLADWLARWPDELRLREQHGFRTARAYLQEHAEPKLTWLYSHVDSDAPLPGWAEGVRPHVFGNVVVRPVQVELLDDRPDDPDRTICLRRYSIVGDWADFLSVWRRIVVVRERYGFRCRFAVVDEPKDLFTWAFDLAGDWTDLPALQRPYYADPERVELRRVFDFMADYTLDPARPLPCQWL